MVLLSGMNGRASETDGGDRPKPTRWRGERVACPQAASYGSAVDSFRACVPVGCSLGLQRSAAGLDVVACDAMAGRIDLFRVLLLRSDYLAFCRFVLTAMVFSEDSHSIAHAKAGTIVRVQIKSARIEKKRKRRAIREGRSVLCFLSYPSLRILAKSPVPLLGALRSVICNARGACTTPTSRAQHDGRTGPSAHARPPTAYAVGSFFYFPTTTSCTTEQQPAAVPPLVVDAQHAGNLYLSISVHDERRSTPSVL